jgi:hypothetical protein
VCVLVKHLFRPPRLTHSSRVEREASRSISGVVHPWDPTRKSKRKEEKTLTFTKAAGAYRENLGSERRSQSPIYSMYVRTSVCMQENRSFHFFFLFGYRPQLRLEHVCTGVDETNLSRSSRCRYTHTYTLYRRVL